jgi:hypothetical protein
MRTGPSFRLAKPGIGAAADLQHQHRDQQASCENRATLPIDPSFTIPESIKHPLET